MRVLTRSDEDSLLTFDEGAASKRSPSRASAHVLTEDMVRRLARAAALIKNVFGGKEQDIEGST